MNGEFCRRQTEDQPSATSIDVVEAEYVGHESAIGISVAAEDDDVRTEDHRARLPEETGNVQRPQPIGRSGAWSGFDALNGGHLVDRSVERGDASDAGTLGAGHEVGLGEVETVDLVHLDCS